MTQREYDIFQIIKKEPLISQNEIAARLGITRSAVSAYLFSMTQKGIIQGRGYIINVEEYPLLIGPGHIDITSICKSRELSAGMYTTEETRITYGGAVKNMAHYLARLGCSPRAIFTVSSDFFGTQFLLDCAKHDIQADHSLVLTDCGMPIYNELITKDGTLLAAANAQDSLGERITPGFLQTKDSLLRNASQILVHEALSPEAVEYITSAYADSALVFYAIYYENTRNHLEHLSRFPMLLTTAEVVCRLTGCNLKMQDGRPDKNSLAALCRALRSLGTQKAIILCSLTDTCIMDGDTIWLQHICGTEQSPLQAIRYCREGFAASALYALGEQFDIQKTLDYISATKVIAASSLSFIETNYCRSLVEKTIETQQTETVSIALSL